MKIKYLAFIAIRNLISNRLRTLLTLGGVIIGITTIVFLVSLGFGLQKIVTNQVATLDEMKNFDVEYGESEIIKINDEKISKINNIDQVEKVKPTINIASKIHFGSSAISAVIYGVDKEYLEMIRFSPQQGEIFSEGGQNMAIINQAALNLLFSEGENRDIIGKKISADYIITNDLLENKDEDKKIYKDNQLEVVGLDSSVEHPYIYVPIDTLRAQGVVNYSNLKVKVDKLENIDNVRERVENLGYSTNYVGDTVNQINQFFDIFKIILGGFGGIAMVVAGMGMFNTLTVSLLERIREVGLFKALGLKRRDIRFLFLIEAVVLGFTGGTMGLLSGYLIGFLLNLSINILAEARNALAVEFFYTPWYFALSIALFSILIGIITGFYPARRAVKINALDALRYE